MMRLPFSLLHVIKPLCSARQKTRGLLMRFTPLETLLLAPAEYKKLSNGVNRPEETASLSTTDVIILGWVPYSGLDRFEQDSYF